jgi:hypothetical protein
MFFVKVNDALEGRGKNAAETKQLFDVMKANILQQQQQKQQQQQLDGGRGQPEEVGGQQVNDDG